MTAEPENMIAGIDRPLRLGTRQSPLAMIQAEMVAKSLSAAHGWRAEQVELVPMIATGDKIQDRALADVGGKALWTKELDGALAEGEIDCAVHSMKDVETIRPDGFVIAAMIERADTRDRLVGAKSIDALPRGAVVGTASPRRKAQLLNLREDLKIQLIRGNVQTRLEKIEAGEFAATLLAAAGLDRLGLDDTGYAVADDLMLSAPAQGAIGIEVLKAAGPVRKLLGEISSRDTCLAVYAERAFLGELTGDCHSPIAALAKVDGHKISMRGEILLPDGSEKITDSIVFDVGDRGAPTKLAQKLLAAASTELKAVFGR